MNIYIKSNNKNFKNNKKNNKITLKFYNKIKNSFSTTIMIMETISYLKL